MPTGSQKRGFYLRGFTVQFTSIIDEENEIPVMSKLAVPATVTCRRGCSTLAMARWLTVIEDRSPKTLKSYIL